MTFPTPKWKRSLKPAVRTTICALGDAVGSGASTFGQGLRPRGSTLRDRRTASESRSSLMGPSSTEHHIAIPSCLHMCCANAVFECTRSNARIHKVLPLCRTLETEQKKGIELVYFTLLYNYVFTRVPPLPNAFMICSSTEQQLSAAWRRGLRWFPLGGRLAEVRAPIRGPVVVRGPEKGSLLHRRLVRKRGPLRLLRLFRALLRLRVR